MCTSRLCSVAAAAVASSSSRVHESAKRGASAVRSRPLAARCQRCCSDSASRQPVLRRLVQPRRRLAANVHQALADRRAQSRLDQRVEDRFRAVDRFHRQHGRRAAERELGRSQSRRHRKRAIVVRRFERPDPPPQPVEKRQVLGETAEQRLAEVQVRLDEAGQQQRAARVDGRIRRGGPPGWLRPRRCVRRRHGRRRQRRPTRRSS